MRRARGLLAGALAAALLLAPSQLALAQAAQGCQPGESPHFSFGFGALKEQLGDAMGDPVTCEYTDPNGTGDIEQQTSTGLAFWRKSTNTPTFTDGSDHWAQTPQGWVTWTGASVDPPVANSNANAYPSALVQAFLGGCKNVEPNSEALSAACDCAIQRIQATYTLDEFLQISSDFLEQGAFPPDFSALIATCA